VAGFRQDRVRFERSATDREIATCPIDGFHLKAHSGRFKNLRYLNRGAALSVAAAMNAVKDAGLDADDFSAMGLFVGAGPNLDLGGEFPDIQSGRLPVERLQALWILRFLPNTAASVISALAGIHGDSLTVSTACTASLQAIGEAFRRIRYGFLETALAGGGDSRLNPGGILAYKTAQALFRPKEDPKREYAPFDKSRNGFIPGEGGAFFLLESIDHARARGARIVAEICGYGSSSDGHGMTAPMPDGKWPERAVRSALEETRTSPETVDLVAAHGTGTPLNDAMEANLIARLYGNRGPGVIALKSWVGHTASACGAVELALLLVCLGAGFAPEIRNLSEPCHEDVDFVRSPTAASPRRVVLQSFGFGGQNSALLIKPCNGINIE
jgi:3-oxoacyl-[acyl-carrier-protein] synthase II